MRELIERISENADNRKETSCCAKILKKCSFKSAKDLGNVTELATWLYVFGHYDDAVAVCDILKDMEFTGNYTLWDQADYALCLKARILRKRGDEKEREELLKKVNEHRHPELYGNLVDWYRGTLNENINSDSGITVKWVWIMTKLVFAIKYREAGGHPIPDEEFEKDIAETVEKLRTVK